MSQVVRAIGAAAVAWSIPFGSGLYVFLEGAGVDANGQPDDAPYQVAAFFLMLSPVFLAGLAGYFLTVTFILRRLNRLSVIWMLAAASILSFALGIVFFKQDLAASGLSDAVISFLVTGFSALLSLASGSFFWMWRAGTRPPSGARS